MVWAAGAETVGATRGRDGRRQGQWGGGCAQIGTKNRNYALICYPLCFLLTSLLFKNLFAGVLFPVVLKSLI
jgi:hypothetical protein